MMADHAGVIPEALRTRLELIRPELEINACVQPVDASRPDGPWRLRFHQETESGRRHRSLRLGDREAAESVRALIQGWREERQHERQRAEEEAQRQREAQKRKEGELLRLRKLAVALGAGGRRRRRRTARAFDEAAAKGAVGLYAFAMDEGWSKPNPRGGRPSGSGLW